MKSRAIGQWIDAHIAAHPLRAKSLLVTVLGDMIVPHGGVMGLAGFIRLVEPLGLNPRLVRTSVFRLSREKWLVSEQIGRRSYYSITESARRRFDLAAQRFYGDARQPWDGDWRLVLLPNDCLPALARETLRKELAWAGFAQVAPGVLAHPSAQTDGVLDILQNAGAHDRVVVMAAKSLGALSARPLKQLVDQCWSLRAVNEEYQAFVDAFRPLGRLLKNAGDIDPEQAFVVRTLLMHGFRRAHLRDPLLPCQLEPVGWSGDLARAICQDIYRAIWAASARHLVETLDTADGPLPEASPGIHARFAAACAQETEPAA